MRNHPPTVTLSVARPAYRICREVSMTRSLAVLARAAALSLGLLFLIPTVAEAQTTQTATAAGGTTQSTPESVPVFAQHLVGKSVWITADGARVRGKVTALSDKSLVLTEGNAPTTIPFSSIVRVEKSTRRVRNGTYIGLAAGIGLVMVAAATTCDYGCDSD